MLPNKIKRHRTGPRNAPIAPMSFQSPAPIARSRTKGSNNPKANPAPSREILAPDHPEITDRKVIPARIPGTVTQLGILRVLQSETAARKTIAKTNAQIISRGAIQISSLLCVMVLALFKANLSISSVSGISTGTLTSSEHTHLNLITLEKRPELFPTTYVVLVS
jgi:hypothetical protein